MSEKLSQHENLPAPARHELLEAHAKPEKSREKNPELSPEKAREAVAENAETTKNQASPLEQLQAAEKAPQPVSPQQISRDLRQASLQHSLVEIRRRLSTPQRSLSRVIHQPAVRAVSQVAGSTVSRPSGLLGGGLVAFLGTSSYLYFARHLGFRYNYLVFLMLLTVGFVLGVAIEGLVYLATRGRRQND